MDACWLLSAVTPLRGLGRHGYLRFLWISPLLIEAPRSFRAVAVGCGPAGGLFWCQGPIVVGLLRRREVRRLRSATAIRQVPGPPNTPNRGHMHCLPGGN